jgi:hypothetical protein
MSRDSALASRTVLVTVGNRANDDSDYRCDGSKDADIIQRAIDFANECGGGVVFIRSGLYIIFKQINLKAGVKIQGEGHSTILSGSGVDFNIFEGLGTLAVPMLDVEICDLKIDGTNVTTSGSYTPVIKGIHMQYAKRLKIHGVYVYNTYASGIGTDFLIDSIIDRCITESCGRGFSVGGTVGSNGIGIGTGKYANESWVVSNCVARNNGNCGMMCEAQNSTINSQYMTFSNCLSYNNGTGFLDSGVSRVSFENCWAWANTLRSGFLINAGDISIGSGVYMPSNVHLIGCRSFDNSASAGFVIDNDQLANDVTLGYRIRLTSCIASGNGNRGFYIHNVSKVSLTDCVGYRNAEHGVLAFSDTPTVPMRQLHIIGGEFYNNGTSFSNTYDGIRMGYSGSGIFSDAMVQGVKCYDDSRVVLSDGAMTSGTAILTSANGLFSQDDVGKSITVNGAGVASANLSSTILSVQNSNQATLANNASTTVSGATVTYGSILQRYGVSIAGTTNNSNIRVLDSDLRNNNSAFNTGAISTLEIRGCAGLNPVGPSSVTPGASPYTYTAGNSPEELYIFGGVVTDISKGGVTIGSVTGIRVHLEPNQTVVTTYSSAPTMVKDVQ